MSNYVICTTGRARSSVLMFYLKQVGAGLPDEWFNPWFNRQRDFYNLDDLCKFVSLRRKTDGICSLRTTFTGLLRVCRVHDIRIKPLFDKAVPDAKYIYFTRDNLRQIVESLYYEQVQLLDDAPKFLPSKDIETTLVQYAIDESCWEIFFEKHNIDPLRLTCEMLVADPEATLRLTLQFLEIPYPEGIQLVDKSSDALTNHDEVEAWYHQFMKRYVNIIKGA